MVGGSNLEDHIYFQIFYLWYFICVFLGTKSFLTPIISVGTRKHINYASALCKICLLFTQEILDRIHVRMRRYASCTRMNERTFRIIYDDRLFLIAELIIKIFFHCCYTIVCITANYNTNIKKDALNVNYIYNYYKMFALQQTTRWI